MKNIVIVALALMAASASAEPVTNRFYGYARDLKTGKYLYTEVHDQQTEGDVWIGGKIKYVAADGSALATKTLSFGSDPLIPVFKLSIPREGYVEAITEVGKTSYTMLKTNEGKTQTEVIEKTPGMAADAGFNNAVVAHFEELMAGKTLKFRFGVAGQLDTYDFRCKKIGEATIDGKSAVRFVVEPDSLLRLLAGPLEIAYEISTRHLIDYKGVSNMHDPATGKAYNVHIVYTEKPPADAPKNLPPLD